MSANVNSALAALSAAVGQVLELDAEGECCLAFEGDVEIVVAHSPARGLLTLRAALVAHSDAYATLRDALELNYAQLPPQASIALDPLGEALVLYTAWSEDELVPSVFVDRVCVFVAAVPAIRGHLVASGDTTRMAPWAQGERACL